MAWHSRTSTYFCHYISMQCKKMLCRKKCSFAKSKKGKRQRMKPTNDIAIYDDCVSYRGTEYTCILLFLKKE